MVGGFPENGVSVFDATPTTLAWAHAAHGEALRLVHDRDLRDTWLRHKATWFVGVDVLPNGRDGSIGGAELDGPWAALIEPPAGWHQAQLSVTYPGYPGRDAGESEAAHRFRVKRCAAHVDGLLLEQGRRYLREPHAFVLGIALNTSDAAPLTVWPGSHRFMGRALSKAIGSADPAGIDLTDVYKAARAQVFKEVEPVRLPLKAGQSVLLHRHLLHGIAPWGDGEQAPPEGRMTAYFRPHFASMTDWLLA